MIVELKQKLSPSDITIIQVRLRFYILKWIMISQNKLFNLNQIVYDIYKGFINEFSSIIRLRVSDLWRSGFL